MTFLCRQRLRKKKTKQNNLLLLEPLVRFALAFAPLENAKNKNKITAAVMQAECITKAVGLMFLKWYPLYKKKDEDTADGFYTGWKYIYKFDIFGTK